MTNCRGWIAGACAMAVASAVAPGGPVRAHHSLSGVYDGSNTVSIEGTVSQFHFINPHPFVTVSVKGDGGKSAEWRLEMDNRFELEAIGMTSRTLRPGDKITARGSRGRDNANSLYIRRLERPADGFWYEQVGMTPRMRPPRD